MSTAQCAPQKSVDAIVHFLRNGSILKNFTFPRLHLPNIHGYDPGDYRDIGDKLAAGDIDVVLAEGSIAGAKAFYKTSGQGANTLNLTPLTSPLNKPEHWSTIVHEATHMIQDMKKWRVSLAEMEADAHFAQALFLHYKGASLGTGYMPSFDAAARAFAAGDKKLFKSKCPLMLAEVGNKYDGKAGYDDLFIKKRLDGN